MADPEVYKAYLESLTTRDLIKLADKDGIDLSPGLDRFFVIGELLDNAYEEPQEEIPGEEEQEHKTSALPTQFHVTYMEVLPRDPQWAYVCWELKAQDRERFEKDSQFEGYALRAYEKKGEAFVESFTVPVGVQDNSWYLGFTGGGIFKVGLWVRGLDLNPVMSHSFELPAFINSPKNQNILEKPLNRLCGAADFAVLKDIGRLSRIHQ
jgi:hypothetical protein